MKKKVKNVKNMQNIKKSVNVESKTLMSPIFNRMPNT